MGGPLTNRGRMIDHPAGGEYFAAHEDWAVMARGCGASWKAATMPIESISASHTQTDSYLWFTPIFLPAAATLTGVVFYQATQGVYTGDQNNYVYLYRVGNNGVITRVAATSNNANLWKGTANSYVSEPFASTYAAQPGMYVIGHTWQASATTTAPALGGHTVGNTGLNLRTQIGSLASLFPGTMRYLGPNDAAANALTMLPDSFLMNTVSSLGSTSVSLFWGLY